MFACKHDHGVTSEVRLSESNPVVVSVAANATRSQLSLFFFPHTLMFSRQIFRYLFTPANTHASLGMKTSYRGAVSYGSNKIVHIRVLKLR